MNIDYLILLLDLMGITASAVAATILAQRKGLDIFGAFLIAAVASIGGGTLRDLLLNNHPIFWLVKPIYLTVIFISSLLTLLFYRRISQLERPLRIFDAIGLAAFTIIGIEVALRHNMSPVIAIMMGIVTSTLGGVARDIICNEIPLVLRKEIYITASLIGGCLLLTLNYFGVPREINYPVTIITIFSIRLVAIYKDLRLPRINH